MNNTSEIRETAIDINDHDGRDICQNNNNIIRVKKEVDSVIGIMKQNVEKVLERDIKLSNLEDKSETLVDASNKFETTSRKLKRKMYFKNIKFMAILMFVVTVLILIIVLITIKVNN